MFRRHLLALCACSSLPLLLIACGGDGGDDDDGVSPTTSSTSATPGASASPSAPTVPVNSSTEPTVGEPASKYTLLLADIGSGYFTDRQHTFELTVENYATTASFPSPADGQRMLKEWGYMGGFETAYEPEGRTQDVLNGKFYVAVETHLFESPEGAQAAYAYFEEGLRAARRAEPIQAATVGNQSSAWRYTDGKISGSSINGVFHRFVIRRGNMVAVVQTWGADPLMRVDTARGFAAILDEKALGRKESPEPTPTPGP
ncbi:MAG: hypothetical protein WD557_15155 [Dehalococcoidia bacterium]